ncbi:MAG: hypothetical protein AB1673_03480 [Actinomycetota bacterium]
MSEFSGDFDFTGDLMGTPPVQPSNGGNGHAAEAEPVDFEGALAAAEDFIEAVVWGEHHKVWELIGTDGRTEVLDVATKRGMDEGLAARLAADDASPAETSEFLTDLVNGLRSELAGNDLDSVTYEVDETAAEAPRAAVRMLVPLHKLLGGTLPIGTLYLVPDAGTWKVERLIPLTSK